MRVPLSSDGSFDSEVDGGRYGDMPPAPGLGGMQQGAQGQQPQQLSVSPQFQPQGRAPPPNPLFAPVGMVTNA